MIPEDFKTRTDTALDRTLSQKNEDDWLTIEDFLEELETW